MTPEIIITRYLLYNKYFTTYYVYIYKYIKDNKELKNVLKAIESIFNTKKNKEEDISLDELDLYLSVEYRNEYDSIYKSIVESLRSITNLSEDILLDLLNKIKDRQIATELAILSLEVSEGLKVVEDIFNKCDEFTVKDIVNHEELFVSDDLEVLKNETIQRPGLRWRLGSLNQMLGSLRQGDFGFLFARPETGKTTFLASEVTYFAEQTTRPILWFNNEEQGNKVMLRCYQAALGQTLEEVLGNVPANRARFQELTGNRIRIFDSATISRHDVERMCESLQPALVVFDQIDKIKGFDGDREDLRLGSIYVWAREIAKSYCPVIGVCQANGDGEGKAVLTMDHVSNARTSKQAEADWILGIGKTHDQGFETMRTLHLSKNKLMGDPDTDQSLRHGTKQVQIRADIARYLEVSK